MRSESLLRHSRLAARWLLAGPDPASAIGWPARFRPIDAEVWRHRPELAATCGPAASSCSECPGLWAGRPDWHSADGVRLGGGLGAGQRAAAVAVSSPLLGLGLGAGQRAGPVRCPGPFARAVAVLAGVRDAGPG